MDIGKEMYNEALSFLNYIYGENKAGEVAILRVESGEFLISIWPDCPNESVTLCTETGAICEGHELNKNVTHSLCF